MGKDGPRDQSQGFPAGFARLHRRAERILEINTDQLPDTPEMMQTMLSWFDLEILRVYGYDEADMPFLEAVAKHLPDTQVPLFSDAQSQIPAAAYAQLADPDIAEAEVRPDCQAPQPCMAERYWIGDAESDLEAYECVECEYQEWCAQVAQGSWERSQRDGRSTLLMLTSSHWQKLPRLITLMLPSLQTRSNTWS